MIPAADRWGPFADGLDRTERVGRLRTLQAITHLSLGPRGEPLVCELRRAETGKVALEYALAGLNSLAPLDRRRILASYAALSRPSA